MTDFVQDQQLSELAASFLQEVRAGKRPSINVYADQHPDLAEEIRDAFPSLLIADSLQHGAACGGDGSLLTQVKRPEVLGDFRILQEIGAGGMGVVYEAEQISLARHVALKVLPYHKMSDAQAVRRFQQEAKAAAALVHPNIVPVYDVGRDGSVWYYAMQFIHGQSLHEVRVHLERLLSHAGPEMLSEGQATDLAHGLLGEPVDPQAEQPLVSPGGDLRDELGSSGKRQTQIRRVVDDCVRKRAAGCDLSDQTLVAKYPELMPELEGELKVLRLLQASSPPDLVVSLRQLSSDLSEDAKEMAEQSDSASTVGTPSATVSDLLHEKQGDTQRSSYFRNLAALMADVAAALAYAHDQGIVHRDIKPANLLLDTSGRIWVTDFGLACELNAERSAGRRLAGTLRYMAPEQIRGQYDARSDVYSLGMTLYEMATLQCAIQGNDIVEMIDQICELGPPPPRQIDRRIPRDLERIILRAVARDREERYLSARELELDLRRFTQGQPVTARRIGVWERSARWCWQNVATVMSLSLACVAWCLMTYMWIVIQRQERIIERQRNSVSAPAPFIDE